MGSDSTEEWNRIWLEQYEDINRAKMLRRWKKFDFDSLPRDASILDLGAGRGEFLVMLRERGFSRLRGIEPEASLIERGPRDLLEQGSCLELDGLDERFDVVTMFGVLHHLESFDDMKRTAASISRILVPGGRFYSVEPWKNLIRTLVTRWVLETPLARLHPFFRTESRIWKIEKPLQSQWLRLEGAFIDHMQRSGFEIVLDKKDLRAHYLVYRKP